MCVVASIFYLSLSPCVRLLITRQIRGRSMYLEPHYATMWRPSRDRFFFYRNLWSSLISSLVRLYTSFSFSHFLIYPLVPDAFALVVNVPLIELNNNAALFTVSVGRRQEFVGQSRWKERTFGLYSYIVMHGFSLIAAAYIALPLLSLYFLLVGGGGDGGECRSRCVIGPIYQVIRTRFIPHSLWALLGRHVNMAWQPKWLLLPPYGSQSRRSERDGRVI